MISGNIFTPQRGRHSAKRGLPEGLRIMGTFAATMAPLVLVCYLWLMGVV